MFLLASIHLHFASNFNLKADLIGFGCALAVALLISMFTNWTENIEVRFVRALTRMMNHRRWFTFWLIGFFMWATVRSIILGYIDWDTIILTGLWSWWPFAVENIVKVTQGQTLNEIAGLAVVIKEQNDKAAERDEDARLRALLFEKALNANTSTLQRVLDAIEDREGGDLVHGA